jgi:hypothetical protein
MSRFSRLTRIGRRAVLAAASLTVVACTEPVAPNPAPSSGSGPTAPPSNTVVQGRILAGGRNVHSLMIGMYDNYVIVEGDGDTDLDCWLYDSAGRLVSSDTDFTDICVLPSPGLGAHQLVIRNLGSVYNDYAIWTET